MTVATLESAPGTLTEAERARAGLTRLKVLSRLAPVFHHELAGAITPIAINVQLGKSLMQRPDTDMSRVGGVLAQVESAVGIARERFENLVGWLAMDSSKERPLGTVVYDALNYLRLEFALRQISLDLQVSDQTHLTLDRGLMFVLIAASLAIFDQHPDVSALRVERQDCDEGLKLLLCWTLTRRLSPSLVNVPREQLISWPEVLVLASYYGIDATPGEECLTLVF